MYYMYVLRSKKDGSYYIGQTKNLEERLIRHNLGHSKSTKAKRPWELFYYEPYENRGDAQKRENQLKKKKNRTYISELSQTSSDKNRFKGRGVAQSG